MKIIIWLVAIIAAFAAGCLLGYVRFGIVDVPEFKDITIPFLSMLGSWFSAFGTILAVVVSLFLAMKARRENTEQISATVKRAPAQNLYEFGTEIKIIEAKVVNVNNVRCEIQGVFMRFSTNKAHEFDMDLININVRRERVVLSDRGQNHSFLFRFNIPHNWAFFTLVEEKFEDGNIGVPELVIYSSTKEYKVRLSADVQHLILKAYQDFLQDRKIQ